MTLDINKDKLLVDIISKNVLLPGESRKNLNKIKERMAKDYGIVGPIEEILCSKIISDTWRLQRLYKFETQILLNQQSERKNRYNDTYDRISRMNIPNKKRFRSTAKQIEYTPALEEIQKHISVLENGMLKTVAELSSLQKQRLQK